MQADEAARKAALTEDDFKDDPAGLSDWYKEKGNTFYKNKQFDEVCLALCEDFVKGRCLFLCTGCRMHSVGAWPSFLRV
jgi:hypothetical protein